MVTLVARSCKRHNYLQLEDELGEHKSTHTQPYMEQQQKKNNIVESIAPVLSLRPALNLGASRVIRAVVGLFRARRVESQCLLPYAIVLLDCGSRDVL